MPKRGYNQMLSGTLRTVRVHALRLFNGRGRLPFRRGRGIPYILAGLVLFILYRHFTAKDTQMEKVYSLRPVADPAIGGGGGRGGAPFAQNLAPPGRKLVNLVNL